MFAADSACPGWGLSAWMSAANTASVPASPSMLIAAAMSAVSMSRSRSASARHSMPSIPSVPLMRARPSFSCSRMGVMPAAASASAVVVSSPGASEVPTRTSPSPIAASAQWASGARSPEQPSEPYSPTTGVIPALSIATYASATRRDTPVRPVARVARRSTIVARTTSRSTSGPEDAACERTRDRCNSMRRAGGMCCVASAPKPVETP